MLQKKCSETEECPKEKEIESLHLEVRATLVLCFLTLILGIIRVGDISFERIVSTFANFDIETIITLLICVILGVKEFLLWRK